MNENSNYYKTYKKPDVVMDKYYELQALKAKETAKSKELTKADEIRAYLAKNQSNESKCL